MEEEGHAHEGKEPSHCVEEAFQRLLWTEGAHGAPSEGVVPWVSSVGALEEDWGEVVLDRGVEGNVACAMVEEREDVGVGLYQGVHPADLQKQVGYFQEVHPEDHLEVPQEVPLEVNLEVHLEDHPEVHREVRLEVSLEDHPPGYLMEKQIQNRALI